MLLGALPGVCVRFSHSSESARTSKIGRSLSRRETEESALKCKHPPSSALFIRAPVMHDAFVPEMVSAVTMPMRHGAWTRRRAAEWLIEFLHSKLRSSLRGVNSY